MVVIIQWVTKNIFGLIKPLEQIIKSINKWYAVQ